MISTENKTKEFRCPDKPKKIMDLVSEAGIDVSVWALKSDGSPVNVPPAANPQYCYEWAFGGEGEPIVLCVWYKNLKVAEDAIWLEESMRQQALKLERAVQDSRDQKIKSRARDQAKRARRFDSLLQRAFRRSLPVRVVLLEGKARKDSDYGLDSAKVDFRSLDSEHWYVHSYIDETGHFRLVRSLTPRDSEILSVTSLPEFLDQFLVEKRAGLASGYVRNAEVRRKVLQRAAGVCELCGQSGFTTADGAIYLETHHIIPLADGGPDTEWNVAAICPNDHRKAHYSVERDRIREALDDVVCRHFQNDDVFQSWRLNVGENDI